MKPRPDAKKSFDLAIKGLSQPNTISDLKDRKSSIVLAHSIKRSLKQFHLEQVDFYDVVSEVYLRGINKINSGENIKNPGAWIRVTSSNVIREMSRQQQKEQANSKVVEVKIAPKSCEENNNVLLGILNQSLVHLSEKERQILELKFFQNLSWKEIVEYLTSTGEILNEGNARKKGSRALKKLKKAFFSSLKSNDLSA